MHRLNFIIFLFQLKGVSVGVDCSKFIDLDLATSSNVIINFI